MSVETIVTISVLAGVAYALAAWWVLLLVTRLEQRRAIRRRLGLFPGKGTRNG